MTKPQTCITICSVRQTLSRLVAKDPFDADVRLASFSLLATSTNPLLLQKLKVLAQNDADARIQHVAEQIHDDRNR